LGGLEEPHLAEADADFVAAGELMPGSPMTPYCLAATEWKRAGKSRAPAAHLARALELLDIALKVHPRCEPVSTIRGPVLDAMGRTDPAIRELREFLEERPESTRVLGRLAEIYYLRGRKEEAWDCLHRILEIDPLNAAAVEKVVLLER